MNLDADDKRVLGEIAKLSLKAALAGRAFDPVDPGMPALEERRGCFVTLKTGGSLRGCLGCFTSDQPLYRTVADYAAYSATEDPRFISNRLKPEELSRVEIEVSALTPLELCVEPERIVPGVHGIYVKSGGKSGCFLPQVATDMHWGVEEFWGHCCRDKAGLEWDAWRRPGVLLMTFTAEAFPVGEE